MATKHLIHISLLVCVLATVAGQDADDGAPAPGPALPPAPSPRLPINELQLPPGFRAEQFADTPNARMLELGQATNESEVVFVSSTKSVVTAVVRRGNTTTACELLNGLNNPNGIAYSNGSLYVATVDAITRYDGVDAAALAGCDSSLTNSTHIVDLPATSGHTNRALALNGTKLYVSIGSVDNAGTCKPPTCTIQVVNADGSGGLQTYASQFRNAAGIAFQPSSGRLYFTNMGRDNLGDDQPDDTLFSADKQGLNGEFPFCHWVGVGDPEQRDPGPGVPLADPQTPPPGQPMKGGPQAMNASYGGWCAGNAAVPLQALGPHVAPIGLAFYPNAAQLAAGAATFPAEYQGGVFVAEHGSWNRQQKIGYRVVHLSLGPEGHVANHTVFAHGWLRTDGSVWGRPVGLLVLPDGSLLVSDDYAGATYRIYSPEPQSARADSSQPLAAQSLAG